MTPAPTAASAAAGNTRRADVAHQWMDPVIVAGPWLLAAALGYRAVRRISGHR